MAKHVEGEIQRLFVKWYRAMDTEWPELKYMHSIPNGYQIGTPKKTAAGVWVNRSAGIAKAEGLKAGVWDLCLPYAIFWSDPERTYVEFTAGLYIETKKSEYYSRPHVMEKQNPDQVEWKAMVEQAWWRTFIYYNWEDAARRTLDYLTGYVLTDNELDNAWKGVLRRHECLQLAESRSKERIIWSSVQRHLLSGTVR